MTSFTDQAWQRAAPLRAAIDAHPFNQELAAGTLSRDRFQCYIIQDALYLCGMDAPWPWPARAARTARP